MDIYCLEDADVPVEIDRINGEGEAIVDDDLFGEHEVNIGRVTRAPGDEVMIKIRINQMGEPTGRCVDEDAYHSSVDSDETQHHDFELSESAAVELAKSIDNSRVTQRKH